MATYVVGDLQGCLAELKRLLKRVKFKPKRDELWLTGDLVARGPASLETLRFVRDLGDSAQTVLGNHDLHLLATAAGLAKPKRKDRLEALLGAEDRDELLHWLRHQPLLARHPSFGFVMTHAGIPPSWNVNQAALNASKVEARLRSDNYVSLLKRMYGNEPSLWHKSVNGIARCRFTINALTRMRYCDKESGALDLESKCAPGQQTNKQLKPWFALRKRHQDPYLVFGHWASLMGNTGRSKIIGLDTGCVWGNQMTLLRWDDMKAFHQESLANVSED